MASTVLPNGIIIPEKYSRDWYNDLYHNWQELDNLLSVSPGDGTLTIQKNGTTVGTFSANQATDETINIEVPTVNDATLTIQKNGTAVGTFSANQSTDETINIEVPDVNNGTLTIQKNGTDIGTFSANSSTDETVNIEVPDVNNGTLTIQQNGTTVDTFTANSSSDKTVNIQCVDLANNQTVGGNKEFTGTTTAHDLVPSATNTYNLGTSTNKWKSLNGINPGALSLQGTNLINIASSITSLDGVTVNKFTPQVNGWLLINGTGPANNGFIYVTQGRIGMVSVNNATNRCAVLIPVVAGVEVSITCKLNTLTWANIAPCQGNV